VKVSFKTGIQSGPVEDIVAVWRRADEIERFTGGWVNDHLYNPSFPRRTDDSSAYEAFTLLGALARETTRLRLGTLVVGNLFRHPALVARQAMTLDHLSGGRFELGLGAGWHEREHGDHGIDLLRPGRRIDALEEGLEIITQLFSEGTATVRGDQYRADGALLEPPPTGRIRILIGGAGERRTLRAVAKYADHWNFGSAEPDEVLPHKLAVLQRHCDEVGRDRAEIEVSAQVFVEDDVTELADRARRLAEYGAEHLIVALVKPDVGLLERIGETICDV
jgi:alkanesulfonate monooxygenase SsuD/methylene tetrahydromethanopterin reductase-like flavin-dependent oxidoreductase (luciferase family)